jgi:hypothetical protein
MRMDYADAIKEVYDHLDKGHVDKAVMTCVRIARSLNDYLSFAMFLREMCPKKEEFSRTFCDATSHLTEDASKFLWNDSAKRFIDTRELDVSLSSDDNDEEKSLLIIGAGELDPELDQCERHIQDMVIPSGMGEFDTAAFADRFEARKVRFRLRIRAIHTVKERIKARCFNYVSLIEHQLEAQRKSRSFLEDVQNEVNNYFRAHSEDVYNKLQKASQLIDSDDSEGPPLLSTEVRRAIKAAADFFYPPPGTPVTCSDGKVRTLGDDQYLNRLDEYLATHFQKSSSGNLLRAEFEMFAVFARRLNDIASKGVHSDVSPHEAKQALMGLYMFLYNLVSPRQYQQAS